MWYYIHSSLYHHGTKGMKWGVRNGPPYPLNSKKARPAKKQDDKRVVGGIEGVIAVTAALTIAAATVYAERRKAKKQAEKILNSLEKSDIMSLKTLPRTEGDHSIESDLRAVNPNYAKGIDYQMNCAYCTAAYELRRRGYEVEALAKPIPTSTRDVEAMYKKAKFQELSEKDKLSEMTREAESWGEGARGSVTAYFGPGIGHIFSVEVQNGKAQFIDPQTGNKIINGKVSYLDADTNRTKSLDMAKTMTSGKFMRTDNLELSDNILNTVKKRS